MNMLRVSTLLINFLFLTYGVQASSWPYGPFYTSGRFIFNTNGKHVTYAGVNWPGAADTMIPEGLQYQSIESIVSKIKSLGMNVIRLTYAIEMIDDILDNGSDVSIQTSFQKALGTTNGTKVFNEVLKNNPSFSSTTTRLQVFDAVAAECLKQQIYVHLDNHVSKAMWCCSETDGNAWFGDTYFNISKWRRGLQYMARHGASWGNLMSMSLRNELRSPNDDPSLAASSYNWKDWYLNVDLAAKVINSANNAVLIFFSGLSFDTNMSPIPTAGDLGNNTHFHKSDFAFSDKLVLELHNYYFGVTSCSSLNSSLYYGGFDALDTSNKDIVNVMPVMLTEWGHSQNSSMWQGVYSQCLQNYLPEQKIGWMMWVIAGSYYIKSGKQDPDESWGLLTHDWSAFRDAEDVSNYLKPMVAATLDG